MRRVQNAVLAGEAFELPPRGPTRNRGGPRPALDVVAPGGEHVVPVRRGVRGGRRCRSRHDAAGLPLRLCVECRDDSLQERIGRPLLVIAVQARSDSAQLQEAAEGRQDRPCVAAGEHDAEFGALSFDALPELGERRFIETGAARRLIGVEDAVQPQRRQVVDLRRAQRANLARRSVLQARAQRSAAGFELIFEFDEPSAQQCDGPRPVAGAEAEHDLASATRIGIQEICRNAAAQVVRPALATLEQVLLDGFHGDCIRVACSNSCSKRRLSAARSVGKSC